MSLHDTDESQLTERERLIMILSVVIYEVEHNMLTEEMRGEPDYYYGMLADGEPEGILAENEKVDLIGDFKKYYTMVFGEHAL